MTIIKQTKVKCVQKYLLKFRPLWLGHWRVHVSEDVFLLKYMYTYMYKTISCVCFIMKRLRFTKMEGYVCMIVNYICVINDNFVNFIRFIKRDVNCIIFFLFIDRLFSMQMLKLKLVVKSTHTCLLSKQISYDQTY